VIVLDVNILVAAAIPGHPWHAPVARFLEDALATDEVAVPDVVWSGFVRTVTNPAVADPLPSWDEIDAFVGAVRSHRGYRSDVRGLVSSVEALLDLCRHHDLRRNLVSDAHIALVATDYNATVATLDTDFDRIAGAVIHPALPASHPEVGAG